MKPAILILGPLALVLGCIGPASADVIFQTGFEPPAYSPGELAGQDGWFGSSFPVVQSSNVQSGAQAAEFDASLVTSGQSLVSVPLSYSSVNNPQSLVRIQDSFFLSATGTGSSCESDRCFRRRAVYRPSPGLRE
jgi:hypothetical protein